MWRTVQLCSALLLALWLVACGPSQPLKIVIDETHIISRERFNGWGNVMYVRIKLENRGDAPVHLYPDQILLKGENGTRGTVWEFRDRYRLDLARAATEGQRQRLQALMTGAGIDVDRIRELSTTQIEIHPGQVLQIGLPFLLQNDRGDTQYAMDLAYHDDATDRIAHLTLSVRSQGAP